MTKLIFPIIFISFLTSCSQAIDTTSTTSVASGEAKNNQYVSSDFNWIIQDQDIASQYGEPHQKVTLQIGGTGGVQYPVGEYPMNCNVVDATYYYTGFGMISKPVHCWWAGGGNEIAVFLENGSYVVKSTILDEGSPYTPPPPIKFEPLFEIKNN